MTLLQGVATLLLALAHLSIPCIHFTSWVSFCDRIANTLSHPIDYARGAPLPILQFLGNFCPNFYIYPNISKTASRDYPPEIFGCQHLARKCKTICYGFLVKMAVTLCARLKADGLHTTGAHSPHGLLPKAATNLWLAVHRQPLEGATGIYLDLDISVIFQDIITMFLSYGRSSSRL